MSAVKQVPEQNYLNTQIHDWEKDETLVQQRNSIGGRTSRLLRRWWLWALIVGVIVAALFDAGVMQAVMSTAPILFRIMTALFIIGLQFFAMIWFTSRTRQYTIMPGSEGVSFKDYRGQPEVLEQAQQIVTLLRGVKAFERAGGEPLNGLLLEGPPGTGKTWLAQAISTEAGVPFYYVDAASLQGTFIGTSTLKVARMYGKARRKAKEYGAAVVFLDEIDTIGSRAGVSSVGGGMATQGMSGMMSGGDMGLLSTMLIEMSGFSLEHGWRARLRTWFYKTFLRRNPPPIQKRVLTIGATNRIDALDPALLRPGRFDKKLRIDAPDMQGRRDIFMYYLSKVAHDESMNPMILASETPGYTPADIKYLLNESLRYALFDGRRYTTYRDFQLAKPEHEMGVRSRIKHLSREARERLAYHEAGHAVAIRLFLPTHRISRITIIRQGLTFGHVLDYPARESYQGLNTKLHYMNELRVSVAGRAGEIEFCGMQNQTLGVGGDFANIRRWLIMMASAGMLGPLGGAMGMRVTPLGVVQGIPEEMRIAMEQTFNQVLVETRRALRENGHVMRALVALLLEKEELLAEEVREFFDSYGLYTPDPTLIRDGEEIDLLPPKPEAELPEGAAGQTIS